jgi:carbamoyltransferase
MYLLGFNSFKHDASAALIHDGHIITAIEEERFNGIKHTSWFPQSSINYCLEAGGIDLGAVDYVCFYWNPREFLYRVFSDLVRRFPAVQGPFLLDLLKSYVLFRTVKGQFFSNFPGERPKAEFVFIAHHLAHAASACYLSGFSEAATMVVDGAGERATCTLYAWDGRHFARLRQVNYPRSLGFFYSAITDYVGFQANNDEYKVMGLSAYGRPKYLDQFRTIVWATDDGSFSMDLSFFDYHKVCIPRGAWVSKRFLEKFGPARRQGSEMTEHYADIAASAQVILEEVLLNLAQWLRRTTKLEYLTMAGGVGLNCLANARLLRDAGFKNIFFLPVAADMGTSIGACLYQYHSVLGASGPIPLRHLYYGPEYSNEYIEGLLLNSKVRYYRPDDLEAKVAACIANGNIIGWFQGRMEFGPRALGARSILADPRRPEMKDVLNAAVKFREEFRPFAPSVTVEDAPRFFEIDRPSPYMILVHRVRSEVRDLIPAVIHVDGTARVHTVSEDVNSRYYCLLRKFAVLTGIPVIVNTSFNVRGQPIVRTPEDALRTFFSTGLDVLAIGDFVVEKY